MNSYVGFVLLFASSVALGQGMTKWVDDKGKVHYGDQPPPTAKEQDISKGTSSSVGVQTGTRRTVPMPQRSSSNTRGSYNDQVMRRNDEILAKQRETVRENAAKYGSSDDLVRRQQEMLRNNENIQHRNRVMSRQ